MLGFLLRNQSQLLFIKQGSNPLTHLRFIHKPISKTHQESNQNQQSFIVSYLINSCGLSPQSALSACKKFDIRRFKSTKNPDSVLDLLKSYSFTKIHIASIMAKYPILLMWNPDTMRPKLEFFLGLGFSGSQLLELISLAPNFLMSSLDKRLKPNFALLTSIFATNQLAAVLRRSSWLLRSNLATNFLPNVEALQRYGVPGRNIARLGTLGSRVMMQRADQFKLTIETLTKMGFDPLTTKFLQGIMAMMGISPSTWKRKVDVYKSLGWSEEEIMSAFRRHPLIMLPSDEKLGRVVDFFAKKMHWGPSFISKRPVILCLSFEKRIVPRCLVMSVLSSKGLVSRESGATFLLLTDKKFLDKYVTKYANQVPEVLDAYKGKG